MLKRLESVQGQLWDSWYELLNAVNVSPQEVSVDALRELLRKHALGNPQILRDDEFGKIWFQQDYRFETPKAQMMFRINSTEVYSSPRNAVLSQLYTDAIREGFNEFGYPVRLAGLEYGINVDKEGINLTFSGYSDRIPELVKTVADRLKKISIDQKTFKTLKEIRLRRYQNFHFRQPYQQAFYFRNLFLEGRKFSIFDYEKEIKKIKLKDLKKFTNKYIFKSITSSNLLSADELILVGSCKGVVKVSSIPQIKWFSSSSKMFKRLSSIYEAQLKL